MGFHRIHLMRIAVLVAVSCGLSRSLATDEREPKSPWDLKMFRFEFDNDTFLGSDDAFTAGWSFHFNAVARYNWIGYLAPAEGGPTESGVNQPPLEPYPGKEEFLFGFHVTRVPFSVHMTYYRYLGSSPDGINDSLDWVNFSFEYRF